MQMGIHLKRFKRYVVIQFYNRGMHMYSTFKKRLNYRNQSNSGGGGLIFNGFLVQV